MFSCLYTFVKGGVPLDAQMCHFGGPTAVNSDQPADPVVLEYRYMVGVSLEPPPQFGSLLKSREMPTPVYWLVSTANWKYGAVSPSGVPVFWNP
jgi:hypothetical protein